LVFRKTSLAIEGAELKTSYWLYHGLRHDKSVYFIITYIICTANDILPLCVVIV